MASFDDLFFATPSPLRVLVENTPGLPDKYEFRRTFRIGRGSDCEICINNQYVSRIHIEVAFENSVWQVRDLNSSNGMFVEGQRTASVPVPANATIRLGVGGPFVTFTVSGEAAPERKQAAAPPAYVPPPPPRPEPVAASPRPELKPPAPPPKRPQPAPALAVPAPTLDRGASLESYKDRYFGKKPSGEPAGQHTMMVRMAFSEVQKKQKSKWMILVGALVLLIVAVSGYAFYERQQTGKQRALAESIFYSMKSLDVDIANFERVVVDTNNPGVIAQLRKYQDRRKEMEQRYGQFLDTLRVRDKKLTAQQRVTLRIARIFGECELTIPADFQAEIDKYIQKWKSSGRLSRAIALAKARGYAPTIAHELLAVDLPPQFFYLALQESDFDPYISGPETRSGIAKGMWQFIPQTAIKYGLRVGPLAEMRRPDPADDRHHWELETKAAASYMKDLYSSDAQASGLLVMACYNWGENQVLPLVRSLPANPQDRNFWKLMTKYRDKLPQETYDYVFYIVSAAIIGEDPKLFGFDFENPLAHLEAR